LTAAPQARAQPARWLERLAQGVAGSIPGVPGKPPVQHRA
jgi:hypothetical protein